jgi:hypothetical protein
VVQDLASTTIYPSPSGQTLSLPYAASQVVAGAWQACILQTTGAVQCWGDNFYGSLGSGTTTDDFIPGHQTGLAGFVATHLAIGGEFVCAQTSDKGNVSCWGYNGNGVVSATTTTTKYLLPTTVPLNLATGLTVTEIAASDHVCAIISDGSLMCWGRGDWLQTGTGLATTATAPAFVQANW